MSFSDDTSPDAAQPSFLAARVTTGSLKYDDEPARFTPKDIEPFFLWATEAGASDVTIQTGEQIMIEVYGKMHRVTNRRLSTNEMMEILVAMYESESAKARLGGDRDLDFAYEIKPNRFERLRFRVNATAINVEGHTGIQITARTIPSLPPKLSDMGMESIIVENMAPKQGMVIITGGTGSGKSTLLASIIRELAEDPNGHRKILTFESPIEFTYDEVVKPTTSIAQSEIGRHLPSFSAGTRNALRRKPAIILVGEARDAETIGEAVTASMTGHLLYSTVHSNGFADTIRRMVNVFPEGEKNSRAVDIISSLRLVVSQRLVPSTDGKRVALREFVVFNDDIVDELLDAGVENLTASCRKVLREHGRSFFQDAQIKLAEGRISERVFKEMARGAKAQDRDLQARESAKQKLAEKVLGVAPDTLSPTVNADHDADVSLDQPRAKRAAQAAPMPLNVDPMLDPQAEPRLDFGALAILSKNSIVSDPDDLNEQDPSK